VLLQGAEDLAEESVRHAQAWLEHAWN